MRKVVATLATIVMAMICGACTVDSGSGATSETCFTFPFEAGTKTGCAPQYMDDKEKEYVACRDAGGNARVHVMSGRDVCVLGDEDWVFLSD